MFPPTRQTHPEYISMPRYPHAKLLTDRRRTVVLSGPHIQVLDTQSGRILHSTANIAREDEDALINSGPIRCSGMSKDGRYLATTGDDKRLKIWDLESLTLLTARELPKKPTSIEFSRNMDILVSDKFGDVFRYALHPNNEPVEEKTVPDALASHENPSSGELILGHASLLTSCLLTPDEKFIITADRDEHIRVSWYPEGHVIESYCLGHKKYVSAIHIPMVSPTRLISGGGDLELKVWDWMTGRLQRNITVFAAVEPFIRVTAQNRRRELLGENDDEEPVKSRARRANTGKEKRRNIASPEPEDSAAQKPLEGSNTTSNAVFVVRRISSFLSGGENHVVFSVVGATAIFEFILAETHNQPDIRHYDFGKPVIDFTVCGEGTIWVLLDADFPEESNAGDEHPRKLVQAVQWSMDKFADAGSSMLLDSLNTICSLPAAAEDLQALDLYSDLSSLPKSIDGEQSRVLEQLKSIHEPLEDEPTGEGASVSVGLTKRALGRLKHKRALDQLHHEKADDRDISDPDTKKMKADSDNEELHSM